MSDIIRRVRAVDVRHFETLSADRLRTELRPLVADLTLEAHALVGGVLDVVDRLRSGVSSVDGLEQDALLPFERAIDAAVESGVATLGAVEDVAFLVLLELRQRADRVARMGDGASALVVLGECDGALRRVRKGLAAIDLAIARALHVEQLLDFTSELEESLVVRSAYAKFRARIIGGVPPTEHEVYGRVRAVGTQIAILVGWSAYPLLRAGDRLQLRELQQRILQWLRPECRDDRLAGLRLWQDVVGFAEMLGHINRRQELLAHDARLVTQLLAATQEGRSLHETELAAARRLEGLDPHLDAEIWGSTAATSIRGELERVATQFGIHPRETPHP